MFKRRIGPDPHEKGGSPGTPGCADIWELQSGDFAVIGIDNTQVLVEKLPAGASCGPEERIVVIPRRILVDAKPDIPSN